jgi:hypothetical protein
MKNLYVGNLPHSTTEAELRNLFEAHGAVEKITLVTDRDTGRSRGFGFVEMTNASEADAAIATLNGTDLGAEGVVLVVEAGVGATIIAPTHGSRANHAGSFFRMHKYVRSGCQTPVGDE